VLGRKKTPQTDAAPPAVKPDGKGRATPSRKEAQAANRRPLVPLDRKAATKAARAEARKQQDLEYQAMLAGDEANMAAQHRGPVRRFLRDSADSTRTMAEFFLPVALVVLIGAMIASGPLTASGPNGQLLATIIMASPYGYLGISAIEATIKWRRLKTELVHRFGDKAYGRGLAMYWALRLYQLRRLRMPRPKIKVGELPR
jgi:hypothetical protein